MPAGPGDPSVPRLRRFLDLLPRTLRRQKLLKALYRLRFISPAQPLGFNGNARAWVDLRDAESRASYLAQAFWPEFHPIVAAFLRSGGDLFDVGSNFGLVTFGVAPLVRGLGTGFHLFEANPRIIPLLHRSASLWPGESFSIHHCCVSDRPGVSHLRMPDDSWGHALITDTGDPVPNLVLDDYIEARQIERIAFLKMDVEGWEPHALQGARRALTSGKVAAAFVEVAPDSLRRTGTSAADLLHLLEGFGFDLYFCAMWDSPDPHGSRWVRVAVNGTSLRFAVASPLPATFALGDVLAVHRSNPLALTLRDAMRS
jgi:FkbM family methyltransferase